jgi:integrase
LYLIVSPSGARKWVYRFTSAGRVTEMGLGSAAAVSLRQARDKAHDARKLRASGENPIVARRRAALANAAVPTFGSVAAALIAAKESGWRNEKHKREWGSSLTRFCGPLLDLPVNEIDTAAIRAVLNPLWQTKPETASRLRGRIEAVLDAAKAQGYRSGENPAAWRGHLAHLLPKRPSLSRGHHAAMEYREIPSFIALLRERDGMAAMALEFCILTAARSGEVYGARWSEIDLAASIWTLPAARMKGGREHRIPLCARAFAILEALSAAKICEFVFPSPRGHRPLSHVAMTEVMERMNIRGSTVHGFRSSFRDWCGNETNFPREVAEEALAHVVGDKAEQAYRRSDALDKRRALMEAWGQYCQPAAASKVVALRRLERRTRG